MNADLFTKIQDKVLSNAVQLDAGIPEGQHILNALDNLPVKIIIADARGKAEYWNKQWYDYTGLPADYPKNKLWKAALHPDDIQRTYNGMLYSVRTGSELQIEYRLKRAADEQYRWHLARAVPLVGNAGDVSKWLVAVTDIHDQKEAEYAKDVFMTIASHELKTPLTTLKTLIHLCKNDSSTSTHSEILEQAEKQLLRMEKLIGNLLDVSRVNDYKMVYHFEEFNFGEMVRDSIEHMQQQTNTHTIMLEQNARVLFRGDKLKLEQVMNNLLSNAIKYSPDADKVIVKTYVLHNEIYVSVQDFGIGIAAENFDNIYTAYYRVNKTAADFQGLGIGLYICSEVIKSHLGKLWVQSVPAQGSTFYFKLPINQQPAFASEKANLLSTSVQQ